VKWAALRPGRGDVGAGLRLGNMGKKRGKGGSRKEEEREVIK